MVTVTLQFSVFLVVIVTLKCSSRYGHGYTAVFSVSYGHCHFEVFSSSWSLSPSSVQLIMVTVKLQYLVFLMFTVTLKCSAPHGHGQFEVFI